MFGRYALPNDDHAGDAVSVTASFIGGSPGSPNSPDEDPEYPAENLVAASNTGHLNLPSRPAKLTTRSGYWDLELSSAKTIRGAALIYHNLDAGLNVTIEGGTGSPFAFSQQITIPEHHDDGWPVSPWVEFASPQTFDTWRLSINGTNSLPVEVGRLLLLEHIRDLGNDVRWGEVEEEEWGHIEHPTSLGVETLYDLGGKRRRFNGEFALVSTDAQADLFNVEPIGDLIRLFRKARGRVQPWLLIPDEDVNDAWYVRFEEPRYSRTREMIEHNIVPFRVRELSRGEPWPGYN